MFFLHSACPPTSAIQFHIAPIFKFPVWFIIQPGTFFWKLSFSTLSQLIIKPIQILLLAVPPKSISKLSPAGNSPMILQLHNSPLNWRSSPHSDPPPYDSPPQLAMSRSSDPRPQGPPVRCSSAWFSHFCQRFAGRTFQLLANKSGHLENFASDHTASPRALTSPSQCVLFISSSFFCKTKGCSFLASVSSHSVKDNALSLLQNSLLNCVSLVVFANHAKHCVWQSATLSLSEYLFRNQTWKLN